MYTSDMIKCDFLKFQRTKLAACAIYSLNHTGPYKSIMTTYMTKLSLSALSHKKFEDASGILQSDGAILCHESAFTEHHGSTLTRKGMDGAQDHGPQPDQLSVHLTEWLTRLVNIYRKQLKEAQLETPQFI